jgi:Response regulator containing CheY-like receiver domain and AraC-type DNA-binding domain
MTRTSNGCFRTQCFCFFSLAVFALCCVAATSEQNPATLYSAPKNTVKPQSALFNVSGIGYSNTQDTLISIGQAAGVQGHASDSSRVHDIVVDTAHRVKDTCAAGAGLKKDTLQKAGSASLKSEPVPVRTPRGKKTPTAAFRFRPVARAVILLLSIALIGVVVWFVRKTNNQPMFLSTTRLSIMDKEVQKTCRYIEKNYAKTDLSIAMICSDLVTGGAFLEALFEKELGLSVDQFIAYVRINRARIFIESSPQADAETVGRETGFATTEMFAAAFKKIVGTSFEEYRESRARRVTTNG